MHIRGGPKNQGQNASQADYTAEQNDDDALHGGVMKCSIKRIAAAPRRDQDSYYASVEGYREPVKGRATINLALAREIKGADPGGEKRDPEMPKRLLVASVHQLGPRRRKDGRRQGRTRE